MKKSHDGLRSFWKRTAVWVLIGMVAGPGLVWAQAEAAGQKTMPRASLEKRFEQIFERLDEMAATQKKILEGQAELKEEHKSLRFRIHRS